MESIDIFQTPEQNLVTNPGFEIDGYTNSPTGWNVWLDDGVNGETVKQRATDLMEITNCLSGMNLLMDAQSIRP